MHSWVHDHVPHVTAFLTIVSIAVVFGAVGGVIPGTVLPRMSDGVLTAIPHANAVISTLAILFILLGWRAIRRGAVARHRACMLTSFGLFVAFLIGYLYRLMIVGTAPFPGSDVAYTFVYLPFLIVHVLLAIVSLPFVFYALLLGLTRSEAALYHTRHALIGSVAAVLWVVSFTMGIGVYLMLHHLF